MQLLVQCHYTLKVTYPFYFTYPQNSITGVMQHELGPEASVLVFTQ